MPNPVRRFCPRLRHLVLIGAVIASGLGVPDSRAQAPAFDLNALERQNRLEAAYEAAVAEHNSLSGLFGRAERQQQIDAMRERLAQRELARLDGELKRARQVFGVAPIAFVASFRAQGGKLQKYDAAQHTAWLQRLDTEVERARKVMETVQAKLDQTPEADFPARLDLMKSLALLGGAGSEEEKAYLAAQTAVKEKVYAQGRSALEQQRPADAASAFEYVLRLDADYLEAPKLFLLAKLAVVDLLWAEAPDDAARAQALALLKTSLTSPAYARFKSDAAPALAQIQARTRAKVEQAMRESRMIDGIQAVLQGRALAALIAEAGSAGAGMVPGTPPIQVAALPEENALLQKLRAASEQAALRALPGLAYAYQRVADELLPRQEETQRLLAERRAAAERALQPAVTVQMASVAADRPTDSKVLTGLAQTLDQHWPSSLRRAPEGASPGSGWILGVRIVEAEVASEERAARKIVRTPSGEEISVAMSLLRKNAALAVALRLGEVGEATVEKIERFVLQADGERHDGIEVGGLSLPAKQADLPADTALLDRLVGQAVDHLVAQLSALPSEPLRYFSARAQRLQKSAQPVPAADAHMLAALAAERAAKAGPGSTPPAGIKSGYDRAQLEALLVTAALFAVP